MQLPWFDAGSGHLCISSPSTLPYISSLSLTVSLIKPIIYIREKNEIDKVEPDSKPLCFFLFSDESSELYGPVGVLQTL